MTIVALHDSHHRKARIMHAAIDSERQQQLERGNVAGAAAWERLARVATAVQLARLFDAAAGE